MHDACRRAARAAATALLVALGGGALAAEAARAALDVVAPESSGRSFADAANVPPAALARAAEALVGVDGAAFGGVHPPTPQLGVGPDHVVQITNASFGARLAIYDKTGAPLLPPVGVGASIAPTGSACRDTGLGSGGVRYDAAADRWVLLELLDGTRSEAFCVHVSQGPDPVTTAWSTYEFPGTRFPDFPRLALWNDAYVVTTNQLPPAVYVLPRAAMLAGAPAQPIVRTVAQLPGYVFQALTAVDAEGPTPPPAGRPIVLLRHRDDEAHDELPSEGDFLELWSLTPDFDEPEQTALAGPLRIPIAEFDSNFCGFTSFSCIPQPSPGAPLDPFREVIAHPLVYRRLATHESIVGAFATNVGPGVRAGIRWFELRRGAAGWALHQEGTHAPDALQRWMPSIGINGIGAIALGYGVASAEVAPSLRFAGRLASDAPGTLPRGETELVAGTSRNGSNRYGDQFAMRVDPADDCTFWFTGQYGQSPRWSTRIASLRVGTCVPEPGGAAAAAVALLALALLHARRQPASAAIRSGGT